MKGLVAQQMNSEHNRFSTSVLNNVPYSARGPSVEDALDTDHPSLLESIYDASEANTFVKMSPFIQKVGAHLWFVHVAAAKSIKHFFCEIPCRTDKSS